MLSQRPRPRLERLMDPKSRPALVRWAKHRWHRVERYRPLRTVFILSFIVWCMFIWDPVPGSQVTTLGVSPHFPYKFPEIVYFLSSLETCWTCHGLHYSVQLSGFCRNVSKINALKNSELTKESFNIGSWQKRCLSWRCVHVSNVLLAYPRTSTLKQKWFFSGYS